MPPQTTLYMYTRLVTPQQVFLCGADDRTRLVSEYVDASAPLAEVMKLLELHGLAHKGFAQRSGGGHEVVVKLAGEETLLVSPPLGSGDSVTDASERVRERAGAPPKHLIFYQAYDGCLHLQAGSLVQPEAAGEEEGAGEEGGAGLEGGLEISGHAIGVAA